jgi:hypothetical protein
MTTTTEDGRKATLNQPHLGYTRIELVEKYQYKWLVRIPGPGLEISVYEDEFELD